MSDSKLLSEQELSERVTYLLDTGYAADIIDLVNEQKIAHADMVIGNDKKSERWNELFPEDKGSGRDVDEMANVYREELRAEQRQRNKV